MNALIARYALFYPPRTLRGEHVRRFLREVRQVERCTPEDVRQRQWDRLRAALVRASALPYYSGLFRELQIQPAAIDREAFERLPLLDKPTIRAHYAEMLASGARTESRSTSGSTGAPFVFPKDSGATAYMDAVMYHVYSWHGIEIGAPQARFWGMPFTPRARAITKLKDLLMNRVRCNAFALGEADLARYYQRFISFRPEYLYGYPSLMYEFARFVRDRDSAPLLRPLKAAIGTGELVVPDQRQVIEDVFRTRFVNEYGCSEVGVIGFDCPSGRMHVMAHNLLVEVVKDGRSVIDQEGEVVVTELHARTLPFIRYQLYDRGVLRSASCDCGLPLPLIDVTSGRIDSYVSLPSGRKVYDAIFAYTLKKGVAAFRAVQEVPNRIRLYVVPDRQFTDAVMQFQLEVLREKTGGEIEFVVQRVESLPRERSGKLRYFVSELPSRRDEPPAA
jgi:phenylacetate-CoA ligase